MKNGLIPKMASSSHLTPSWTLIAKSMSLMKFSMSPFIETKRSMGF